MDLITDAGFGKYIVQHDFENDKDKENYINVSFWTNLGISVVMTSLIIIFRVQMATMLGHREYAKCNFYCQYSVNYNIYI